MITNQTYPSNVMITAEVQVNSWNAGDLARAGVGLYTNTSTGQGYDLLFHGTNQVQFLDDGVVWGNSYAFNWQVGTWYWFQLEESNGTLLGKVWAAGTAEPQNWMFQQTGWTDRTGGAPALNGGSADSNPSDGSSTDSFASVSVTTTSVQPDTASAGSALTANAGSAVTFSQATATGTAPLSYAWNFGDGTTARWRTQPDSHVPERGHLHGPVDGHRCPGNSGHEHRDRDGQRQRGAVPGHVQLEHPQLGLVVRRWNMADQQRHSQTKPAPPPPIPRRP